MGITLASTDWRNPLDWSSFSDIAVILASVLIAVPAGYAGAWLKLKYKFSSTEFGETGEHKHAYDTMLGDGKGWRCGVCGIRKEG